MIEVTLMGKGEHVLYLNPHQIEYIEENGSITTIVMLSGKRLTVEEKYPVIFNRIVEYRRQIGAFKNEE